VIVASALTLAALTSWGQAALAADAPIDAYPTFPALPAEGSVLPAFLDDDELVVVRIDGDAKAVEMHDLITLKMQGQGDFDVRMPGLVRAVADRGGESPPSLDAGQVVFMGFIAGAKVASADATMDAKSYLPRIPVSLRIQHSVGGRVLTASQIKPGNQVDETIEIGNLTGRDASVLRGEALGAAGQKALAQTLESLRAVARVYTPELNLNATFPLPSVIPLGPATDVPVRLYVPMQVVATVRLPSTVTLLDAGGSTVQQAGRTTRAVWSFSLPSALASGGDRALHLRYVSNGSPPALDIKVTPFPFPAAVFQPPGSADWASALARQPATADLVVLAQTAAADTHRIGELTPLVGRPGPGPERVQYEFIFPAPPPAAAPPAAPPRPQPLAIAAVVGVLALGAANAWWAWSRH
jgi:hypothetical protein